MIILITGASHTGNLLSDNAEVLALAQKHNKSYVLIDDEYEWSIEL